mmetsp:Transcript_33801/g.81949  ORF Transcript_33801/g.81949 Transcript_33801/m.81949 type:complete len:315 (+) Transcript_33801:1007-1951(+)
MAFPPHPFTPPLVFVFFVREASPHAVRPFGNTSPVAEISYVVLNVFEYRIFQVPIITRGIRLLATSSSTIFFSRALATTCWRLPGPEVRSPTPSCATVAAAGFTARLMDNDAITPPGSSSQSTLTGDFGFSRAHVPGRQCFGENGTFRYSSPWGSFGFRKAQNRLPTLSFGSRVCTIASPVRVSFAAGFGFRAVRGPPRDTCRLLKADSNPTRSACPSPLRLRGPPSASARISFHPVPIAHASSSPSFHPDALLSSSSSSSSWVRSITSTAVLPAARSALLAGAPFSPPGLGTAAAPPTPPRLLPSRTRSIILS